MEQSAANVGVALLTQWRTTPFAVGWNGDGIPGFLGGAEDGRFYYLRNPRTK